MRIKKHTYLTPFSVSVAILASTCGQPTRAENGVWTESLHFSGTIKHSPPLWDVQQGDSPKLLVSDLNMDVTRGGYHSKLENIVLLEARIAKPIGATIGADVNISIANVDISSHDAKVAIVARGNNNELGKVELELSEGWAIGYKLDDQEKAFKNSNASMSIAGVYAETLLDEHPKRKDAGLDEKWSRSEQKVSRDDNIVRGSDTTLSTWLGTRVVVANTLEVSFPSSAIPSEWVAMLPVTITPR
ncbi:hypothetical protein ABHV50_004231 [Vibrio vulnificus]|nr:hypothetical protein [Vibrio vulnificus]HDU8731578.1 hypothetical protein [Vibrio vulnificus]HDU8768338.1 hypothetical protein [Vibrio vulnificus]